jgi:hypothetical protein
MKIDHRINYVMVIDTEACPIDKTVEGVNPENMFTYDIGYAVCDKHGKVYLTRSFVIADIFYGESDLMQSAHYNNKLPQYHKDIENGTRKVVTFAKACKIFREDMRTYSVNKVFAHNHRFDVTALNITSRWTSKSAYRYFYPYGTKLYDTMTMARQVVANTPTYKAFCEREGYMTKNGKPQVKAEVLYRYISGNYDFKESHTGLEDVKIEVALFAKCKSQHKPMNTNIEPWCWRKVQKKRKEMERA